MWKQLVVGRHSAGRNGRVDKGWRKFLEKSLAVHGSPEEPLELCILGIELQIAQRFGVSTQIMVSVGKEDRRLVKKKLRLYKLHAFEILFPNVSKEEFLKLQILWQL